MDNSSESHYAQITLDQGTVRIHYHDLGDPLSAQPPVVMLHGSGPAACGRRNFSLNVEPLVEQGYRVILPDWPGWGKSDSWVCRGSRSESNAGILHRFLDAIGLRQAVHVVGHSMGAHSAAIFALDHPERLSRLVLIAGGNGGRGIFQAAPTEGIRKIAAFYMNPSVARMQDLLATVIHQSASVTQVVAQGRYDEAMQRPDHLASYRESLQANPLPYPDVSARLPGMQAPTLLVWGRDDRVVPLETGLRVASLIPDAEMHIFSQCGHAPQTEHAARFNQLVAGFLR